MFESLFCMMKGALIVSMVASKLALNIKCGCVKKKILTNEIKNF